MDMDDYSYEFEDRRYAKPETSMNEQMGFIDTLRDMQAQNNEQIQTQTHNLGRDITPDLGGLSGSGGYFQGRYQTPQTNALVSNLKSAAQLSALNQVLSNMQAQAKQRYTKAQQDYQKRQYDKANSGSGSGSGSGSSPYIETPATTGEVDEEGYTTGDENQVHVDENGVVIPQEQGTIGGSLATNANAMNSITGGGQLPDTSTLSGYYDLNGQRTGFRVYPGQGIATPMTSYTRSGALSTLQDVLKQGGKIYDANGNDISSTYGLRWRLY